MKGLFTDGDDRPLFTFIGTNEEILEWIEANKKQLPLNEWWSCDVALEGDTIHISGDEDLKEFTIRDVETIKLGIDKGNTGMRTIAISAKHSFSISIECLELMVELGNEWAIDHHKYLTPGMDSTYPDSELSREDPILIEAIKTLGIDKASGGNEIRLVTIPNRIQYGVAESDTGAGEWVYEKHRIWTGAPDEEVEETTEERRLERIRNLMTNMYNLPQFIMESDGSPEMDKLIKNTAEKAMGSMPYLDKALDLNTTLEELYQLYENPENRGKPKRV